MENPFNNYMLHRAKEIFSDQELPAKRQEAFDLWKKVRKHVVTDVRDVVGGQYYTLRTSTEKRAYHTKLLALGKPFSMTGKLVMRFLVLGEQPFDEDGEPNTICIDTENLAARLYRSTSDCEQFLKLTEDVHPAQFFCMVSGVPYTAEFFNDFRETQL